MECVAVKCVLDFELERSTSAKSLEMYYFFQKKANLFETLSEVTTTKRLRSASRYDLPSGSHNNVFFIWAIFSA